jgi:hypothetical protein
LIFLDVDGVLIPFRGRAASMDRTSMEDEAYARDGNPLLDRLDPWDGRRLLALEGRLIWATTWMAEANEVVSPRLGGGSPQTTRGRRCCIASTDTWG